MNLPSGKLMALLAVFAAIGVITGTGAFTTVSADRTATVNVAGDGSALLQIAPGDGQTDAGYVQQIQGTISINLNPNGASGVNYNAVTEFDGLLVVTNNGVNDVDLHIELNGSNVGPVNFYNGSDTNPYDTNITGSENTVTIPSGQSATISMKVDTTGMDASDFEETELIDEITFVAEESES